MSFKNLPTKTKALLIVAGVACVLCIGVVIAVLATGGITNPF